MNLPANAGDAGDSGLTPGSRSSPVWGNVNPLQYSYLENPIDRAVWWATVHRVAKRTRMSDWARSSRVSHQTWRLIFQFCIFCLFILSMGFSMQEYWSRFPFPPSVDQVLSELFTMTCLSWVALHSMAHSFTELCKPFHRTGCDPWRSKLSLVVKKSGMDPLRHLNKSQE